MKLSTVCVLLVACCAVSMAHGPGPKHHMKNWSPEFGPETRSGSGSGSAERFFDKSSEEEMFRKFNRTWSDVNECGKQNDKICMMKFPQTTQKQRRCFINDTIVVAFQQAEAGFAKCVADKLRYGDKCVFVPPIDHRHHFEHMFEHLSQDEADGKVVKQPVFRPKRHAGHNSNRFETMQAAFHDLPFVDGFDDNGLQNTDYNGEFNSDDGSIQGDGPWQRHEFPGFGSGSGTGSHEGPKAFQDNEIQDFGSRSRSGSGSKSKERGPHHGSHHGPHHSPHHGGRHHGPPRPGPAPPENVADELNVEIHYNPHRAGPFGAPPPPPPFHGRGGHGPPKSSSSSSSGSREGPYGRKGPHGRHGPHDSGPMSGSGSNSGSGSHEGRPYPRPRPLDPYTFCQLEQQKECGYGCQPLHGRNKVRQFFECGKENFEEAFKKFFECEKNKGEEDDSAEAE